MKKQVENLGVSHLITPNSIVVNFEGRTFTVSKDNDKSKYSIIKDFLKSKDEKGLKEFLVPGQKIIEYANKDFEVTGHGDLFIFLANGDKELVPMVIAKKLLEFLKSGIDYSPIMNFWLNLRMNPSNNSKQDLFAFLEKNQHPLTVDGNFIAYKKIDKLQNGKLVDNYTKKISNEVGEYVSMKREDVDADNTQACSTGLHVASMSFAKGFSGDVLVELLVNPADVVAVPRDYNDSKMRVCAYKVLNEVILEDDTDSYDKKERLELLAIVGNIKEEQNFEDDINKMNIDQLVDYVLKEKGVTMEIKGKSLREVLVKAKYHLDV